VLVEANTRYLAPALLVGAAAAAWVVSRAGVLQPALELVALLAVADGIRRGIDLPLASALRWAAALALAGAAIRAALAHAPVVRIAAIVLAGAVAVGVGYVRQRELNEDRYLGRDPSVDWILRNASHRSVALAGVPSLAGIPPVWPVFGPRIDNDVEFLGRFEQGQLREYDSRRAWANALRRGRFDLLLVGEGGYGPCELPGKHSDDNAWARSEGFERLAASGRLTLYRLPAHHARGDSR
jgi:hypothetical protein